MDKNLRPIATDGPPRDAKTGLTLPLSKSLDSSAFEKHQAMIAFELEVLSKKLDRFGWEAERNTPSHDRIVMDWMDALQDYPLEEVRAACREILRENPKKVPHEGVVLAKIGKARRLAYERYMAAAMPPARRYEPAPLSEEDKRHAAEDAQRRAEAAKDVLRKAGFDIASKTEGLKPEPEGERPTFACLETPHGQAMIELPSGMPAPDMAKALEAIAEALGAQTAPAPT